MTVKRSGLGRNLSALLSPQSQALLQDEASPLVLKALPFDLLKPGKYQPRQEIHEESLEELAQSIRKQGLLQPIVVRFLGQQEYEILAGERRWRACQIAGLKEVPVIIKNVDDETAMAIALVENLQREDLNAIEQARAMQRLSEEFSLTHQQIADLVSKSRAAVTNYLRLLHLSPPVMKLLEMGDIEMGHARCLLMLDKAEQYEIAQLIVSKALSVRETEAWIARIKKNKSHLIDSPSKLDEQRYIPALNQLSIYYNTKVSLKKSKGCKGAVLIHYKDQQSLEKLLSRLSQLQTAEINCD